MNKLFRFEMKRMKYKKIHIILPLIIVAIGLIGIISGNAFNVNMDNKVRMVNIFQAYTQFSFLFLGFVYIYLFTEDVSKGTNRYISQLGYSQLQQIFVKSVLLYVYTILIVVLFILGYAASIQLLDASYLLLIVSSIVAGTLFTLLFACLMSLLLKKTLLATVIHFLFFILFDILNIFVFGLTNPCDSNSLSTVTIRSVSGIATTHRSLDTLHLDFDRFQWVYSLCPSLVYSIIIGVVVLVILMRKDRSSFL